MAWRIGSGPDFLTLFAFVYVISFVAALVLRRGLRQEWGIRADRSDAALEDPYEVAYLAGGRRRVAEAATAALVASDVARIDRGLAGSRLVITQSSPDQAHDVEKKILAAALAAGGEPHGPRFYRFAGATMASIETALARKGLVETAASFATARFWSVATMVPVIVLGAAKLVVGISRDKPVGFLVFGLVVALVTIGWLGFSRPRCTSAGKRMLGELKADGRRPGQFDNVAGLDVELAYGVALLGLGATFNASNPVVGLFTNSRATTRSSDSGVEIACGGDAGCGGGGCGGCGG